MSLIYVFISVHEKNRDMLRRVVDHLHPMVENGTIAVRDSTQVKLVGWEEAIAKEIEESDLVMVLVSVSYLNSGPSLKELRFADELKRPIFSVLLENCLYEHNDILVGLKDSMRPRKDGLPYPLSSWQRLDDGIFDVVDHISRSIVPEIRADREKDVKRRRLSLREARRRKALVSDFIARFGWDQDAVTTEQEEPEFCDYRFPAQRIVFKFFRTEESAKLHDYLQKHYEKVKAEDGCVYLMFQDVFIEKEGGEDPEGWVPDRERAARLNQIRESIVDYLQTGCFHLPLLHRMLIKSPERKE